MKVFPAILAPLDGSPSALRSLGCAAWLASRLGSRLHILNSGTALPAEGGLESLGVPEKYRSLVELHQTAGEPAADILAAVARHDIGLIVMSAQGESAALETDDDAVKLVGHVTHAVIEQSTAPVLVLPPRYEESLPWRVFLAPISGESETDESLTLALRLAHALELEVTVAHVAEAAPAGEGGKSAVPLSDAAYHELPQMLNELIARACPLCGPQERRRISDFRLCHGEVANEISELIEDKHVDVLIVGWHGQFMIGHAQVLRTLMQKIRCAVLLVKPQAKGLFRLKVGDAFA